MPVIPFPLREASAATLEWPRLRETVAGYASSPLGRAFVLALEPSADPAWLDSQHQRTGEIRLLIASGGSLEFHGLFDLTTLLDQARIEGAALQSTEIASLLIVIERIEAWRSLLATPPPAMKGNWPTIESLSSPLLAQSFAPLLHALAGKIEPDGTLNDDASPSLRRIRRAMEQQQRHIEDSLRAALRRMSAEGATQEDLITIRGERFVIPVKAEFKRRVPGVIHGASSTGQTVYVEPLETIEQNNALVQLLEDEQAEIHRILVAMTMQIGLYAPAIATGVEILAEVESHFARARFAADFNCVRPVFTGNLASESADSESPDLDIAAEDDALADAANRAEGALRRARSTPSFAASSQRAGSDDLLALNSARHPLLEKRLREGDALAIAGTDAGIGTEGAIRRASSTRARRTIVPLTLTLPAASRQLIISGPNTGGKTVALKTLGLLALMAQAGIPIPAEEARLPIFTAIYADIGDAQSIERNLSTFSAHLVHINQIAAEAGPGSLVLLDELGSATDPEEGAALAVAVAGHFLRLHAWSFISTHLTALKVYAANNSGVTNAAVGFNEETLEPTYQLRIGVPGASAGLNIAQRLGLDPAILAVARRQLNTQTADIARFLDQLHAQLAAATEEREALRKREQEVAREKHRLEFEGKKDQQAKVRELEIKLQSLLKSFEHQLRETVRAIDDKAGAQKLSKESERRIAQLRREFSEQFNSSVVAHHTGADKGDTNAQPHLVANVGAGDTVKLKSLGKTGTVQRKIDSKTFEVAIGPMKMRVSIDDISEIVQRARGTVAVSALDAARRSKNVTVSTTHDPDYTPSEINLIGRNVDEATSDVERFLDRAFLAGLPRIRIVHGTGMGILRRALREHLKHHPQVALVTEPAHNEGGAGVTLVDLKL